MKHTFISLCVAFLIAVLVYLALPSTMYVEKAFNILAAAFIGAGVVTSLLLRLWNRHR
jgi:Zn-dependent protease with chaperone function